MAKTTNKPKVPKVRVSKKDIARVRSSKNQDSGPDWSGHDSWDRLQFQRFFWHAMEHYRLNSSSRELKPVIVAWMLDNGYSKPAADLMRRARDWRLHTTLCGLVGCLLRGMPDTRQDFNHGRSTTAAVKKYIDEILALAGHDQDEDDNPAATVKPEVKINVAPTIQERIRDIVAGHIGHFEELQDQLRTQSVKPQAYDYLKSKKVPAAMVGRMREVFQARLAEFQTAQSGEDQQLKEGYSHWRSADFKRYQEFVSSILADLDAYSRSARTEKRARVKKAPSKEKLVSRLKYCREHVPLRLISINPVDIIGAQALFVYNVRTRKLGCYVAEDLGGALTVKSSTLAGFNTETSVQKTLRRPEQTLAEFAKINRAQLRRFMSTIKATEVKLTGRISEDVVLLKVL